MKRYNKTLYTIFLFSILFGFLQIAAKGYMAIKNSIGYDNERPTNSLGYRSGRHDNTNFIAGNGVVTTESVPRLEFSGGYSGDEDDDYDNGEVIAERIDPYSDE